MKSYERLFPIVVFICLALTSCNPISRSRNQVEEARQLLTKGENAFNHDSIPQAIVYLTEAKRISEQTGSKDVAFEADVYMALLYDLIGMPDSAYSQLKQLSYMETVNRKTLGSLYYLRLMAYYTCELDHDYELALEYNDRALKLDTEDYPDYKLLELLDLANRGELLFRAKRYDEAQRMVDSLESISYKDNLLYLSQAYYCQGLLCEENNELRTAYEFYERSNSIAKKYDGWSNVVNSLLHMIRIDSIRHDMDAYINDRYAYDNVKARLNSSQNGYQVAVINEKHNSDLLHKDDEAKQMILFFSLVILLLLVLSLVITFWLSVRNNRIKHALSVREQERLKEIGEREKLEKELLQLRMRQKTEQLQQANRDNLAMSVQIASISDKEEKDRLLPLEQQLRQQDKQFYERLFELYPKLTRNDLRLLGYIRMGMAPSEIIHILNISLDSLHKYRYRLRKKLQLTSEQSLDEFIAKL